MLCTIYSYMEIRNSHIPEDFITGIANRGSTVGGFILRMQWIKIFAYSYCVLLAIAYLWYALLYFTKHKSPSCQVPPCHQLSH